MEVTHFKIKEIYETIKLILQNLARNNKRTRDVEGLTLNWADYIFEAYRGDIAMSDLTKLSKLPVGSH